MKLRIVPARTGVQWFQRGVRTFLKQPLALSGLFFIFMALMSVLSLVPILGNVLALAVLPGATLGLMAATEETLKGKFPMPVVLFSAFRAGRQQLRAMLVLGLIYAVGFLLVLGISATVDGGKFATSICLAAAWNPTWCWVPISRPRFCWPWPCISPCRCCSGTPPRWSTGTALRRSKACFSA